MTHLPGFGISNFRIFKEMQYLEFAPITVIIGPNNSGKSSLINGLKLISKAFKPWTNYPVDKQTLHNLLGWEFDTKESIKTNGKLSLSKNKRFPDKNMLFVLKIQGYKDTKLNSIIIDLSFHPGRGDISFLRSISLFDSNSLTFEIFSNSDISEDNRYYLNFKQLTNKFAESIERTLKLKKAILDLSQKMNNKELNWEKYSLEKTKIYKEYQVSLDEYQDEDGHVSIYRHYLDTNNAYWRFDEKVIIEKDAGEEVIADIYFKSDEILEYFKEASVYDKLRNYLSYENTSKFSIELSKILSDFNYGYNLSLLDMIMSNDKDLPENLFSIIRQFDSAKYFKNVDETYPESLFPEFLEIDEENKLIVKDGVSFSEFADDCWNLHIEMLKREGITLSDNKDNESIIFILAALITLVNYFEGYKDEKIDFWNRFNSSASILFFNDYIKNSVNKIKNSIRGLANISEVSLTRIGRQRFFNVDDAGVIPDMVFTLLHSYPEYKNRCYSFINKWLNEFEFGKKMEIEEDSETGNIKIYLQDFNDEKILLADYGSGTWQFVAMLLKIVNFTYSPINDEYGQTVFQPRVLILEEPEANLHPKLQALLADFMLDAKKEFNIQFIVETHSDLIIRKLQLLVAKYEDLKKRQTMAGKNKDYAKMAKQIQEEGLYINPKDVKIFYFDKRMNEQLEFEHSIKAIDIVEGGSLSEKIPEDFYDASVNLQFELLKLSNSQHN